MAKKTMSYESAYEELQEILTALEEGEIGIDALSDKVKRASELLAFCKEKLRNTQAQVEGILDELQDD